MVLVLLDQRRVAQQKVALNDVRTLQQIPRRHEARDVVGLAVHRVLDELDVGILVQQRVELLTVVAAHDVDLLDARRRHGIKQGVDDPRAPHAHERLGRVQCDGHKPAAKPGRDEHDSPHAVRLQRGQARRRELAVRNPAGLARRGVPRQRLSHAAGAAHQRLRHADTRRVRRTRVHRDLCGQRHRQGGVRPREARAREISGRHAAVNYAGFALLSAFLGRSRQILRSFLVAALLAPRRRPFVRGQISPSNTNNMPPSSDNGLLCPILEHC